MLDLLLPVQRMSVGRLDWMRGSVIALGGVARLVLVSGLVDGCSVPSEGAAQRGMES